MKNSALAKQITPLIQRKRRSMSTAQATPPMESPIHSVRGAGQPLPESVRSYFEPRFGYDFSRVRLHADSEAGESARAVNAKAFTLGRDIVFGRNEYSPESHEGRQLLAHELTHVIQQGTGSTPAIQRVEGGHWEKEQEAASKEAASSAAAANIVGDTEYWKGYALRPDLEALEKVLREVIAKEGFKGAERFAMDYKFRYGWSKEQAELREKIIPLLDQKLKALQDDAKKYIEQIFYPKAVAHLKQVLEDSKKVVDKEAEKYGLTESGIFFKSYEVKDNDNTRGLAGAAKEIIAKYDQITELNKRKESYEDKTYACTDVEDSTMRLKCLKWEVTSVKITDAAAHKQVCDELQKVQQEYVLLQAKHEVAHPILASFRPPDGLDKLKTIASDDKDKRSQTIGEDIADKRKNIKDIYEVADDNKFVWKQQSIMNSTRKELTVPPGSLEDKAVDAKVQDVADSEFIRNLTLGFVSLVGALLASIPSAGGSLVAWGAGAAGAGLLLGASGTSIYEGVKEYQIQKAATGTAFDKAQAISQDDPSLFWLAMLIVLSVVDVAVAASFFTRAAGAVRAAAKTAQAVSKAAEIDEMARTAYRNSGLIGTVSEEDFVAKFKANMKAEVKPPETKPPETKPPESKPPEGKPPEAKPPETKSPETKPPEAKPPETKPPETKPPEEKPPDAKAPEPNPLESAPPKNAEGNYDFTGRQGKQLARDTSTRPYAGETTAEAEARAHQAQQEVRSRLPDLQPCFTSGTPVLTPDGFISIEELQIGSQVLAMNPDIPGALRACDVLELYRGTAGSFCHLKIGGQIITATINHRFYVAGRGWTAANDLNIGDLLLDPDGNTVLLESITQKQCDRALETFNLRVAEISTYFVGNELPVLVHNTNPDWNRPLWWLFGKKANFRPTDTDGVSMRKTMNEADVIDLFKVRKGIEGRSAADPHQAYTEEELLAKGIKVENTPGDGPLEGRLQHGSARPVDASSGPLESKDIQKAVNGLNNSAPVEKTTPKSMGCPK